MAKNRFPKKIDSAETEKHLAENVMVYFAPTCDDVICCLRNLDIDVVKERYQIIILDSVASTVRKGGFQDQWDRLCDLK